MVVVCEALPDAYTASGAGYPAVAVLGAAYPDEVVGKTLVEAFPEGRLVIAFDSDERGRAGAGSGRPPGGSRRREAGVDPRGPLHHRDLNDPARAEGGGFPAALGCVHMTWPHCDHSGSRDPRNGSSHPGRLRSEATFAMMAGVAPIPASSGQTIRYRLNRAGDRQLNRALHTIVLSRMRCHPETKAYVARR